MDLRNVELEACRKELYSCKKQFELCTKEIAESADGAVHAFDKELLSPACAPPAGQAVASPLYRHRSTGDEFFVLSQVDFESSLETRHQIRLVRAAGADS